SRSGRARAVSVDFYRGKWRVRISVNGQRREVGSFRDRADALAAYKAACVEAEMQRVRRPQYEDLTGLRFGALLVLDLDPERHKGSTRWNCRCDCGRTVTVRI